MAAAPRLPNASLRVLFLSMEDVMGRHGVNAVLNATGLARFVNHYPPADLEPCVLFDDYATVVKAVEEFYGPRAARASLIRVGRATFQYALKEHPASLGLAGLALKLLPLNLQVKAVLSNMADAMSKGLNEKAHVEEQQDCYLFVKEECAPCHGRKADRPLCFTSIGGVLEGLRWATGRNFEVMETTCKATGGSNCTFRIARTPIDY